VTSLILNDIGNQIENIANKTAEDILLEMTKKIDDLEVSIVQDILINEIKGEHSKLQTESDKLSVDLIGTFDN
jgi:Holliday junction resolvasome RuvABC DNA-binding subunit